MALSCGDGRDVREMEFVLSRDISRLVGVETRKTTRYRIKQTKTGKERV